ncbi:MAG: cytochrome c maturation protein CcmE [Actinomycetota bacterium]|nr:cytochrome c maturation protein CcmE [Actinomycetota bacterium]
MDVSPRPVDERRSRRPTSARAWFAIVGVAAVLVAVGFVVMRGLGDATLFFYNVDEAVAERDELGDQRFRLQGNVVDGSVQETSAGVGVEFLVEYDGVQADVRHVGNPPDLFQPDIPVVLEGRWSGEIFSSDRILVKHSENYVAENPDRVDDYDEVPAGADADETGAGAG